MWIERNRSAYVSVLGKLGFGFIVLLLLLNGKAAHTHSHDHLILNTILYYPQFFARYIATHKLLHDARMNLFCFVLCA